MESQVIVELFRSVPEELLNESGRVFYSGRDAFSNPSRLYLLGLNPGGSPIEQARETLSSHSNHVLCGEPNNWSAYRDESWQGAYAGTLPLQRRVLHLLRRLDLDAGRVPSSNLIFVRSAREEDLKGRTQELAAACWAFHERVISSLNIEVILCFGKTTGFWVRSKLGAGEHVETFVENNSRGWKSQAFRNANGIGVVIATHPSIADWTNAATDPTHMVAHLLNSSARAN
jgi:uracil-DNA glycosylase